MPMDRLNILAEGIFFSLLNYCLEVFGSFWGLATYDETDRHSPAFRKEDNMKLQVLVNKVLPSLTGLDHNKWSALCSPANSSIHSHISFQSPPKPIASHSHQLLCPAPAADQTGRAKVKCKRIEYKLSISCGSFFY